MSGVLSVPLMLGALAALWLLLAGSLGAGSLVLAAIMAVLGARLFLALGPAPMRLRRPVAVLGLAWVVLVEIVRSNNAVAWLILRPGTRERRSGFVRIRLDMRDPYGLATLACILTATPGTVWTEYDSADGTMLLHVLDLIDEGEWVRIVKDRYERRLMEIFE